MATQMTKQEDARRVKPVLADKVDTCQRCGNVYILIRLEEGEDYNDFGFRHCPFCSLCIDQLTGGVVE